MKTSKNDEIFTPPKLTGNWCINKVKHGFDYVHNPQRNRFIATFWLGTGKAEDLVEFKRKIFNDLKRESIFLDPHYSFMNNVESAQIGWFCGLYPDSLDMAAKEFDLNKMMKTRFENNKDDIMECAKTRQNDISLWKWDGITDIPLITVAMMKPNWRSRTTNNLTTCVVGI